MDGTEGRLVGVIIQMFCEFCGDYLEVGDYVYDIKDYGLIHEPCWQRYYAEIYIHRRGVLNIEGGVE